jgi:adenine phosphoribosyltransferase
MKGLLMSRYQHLADIIRIVPDFPKKGIQFIDITTLIRKPSAFAEVIDILFERYRGENISRVVGIEARGFLFASALAYRLGAGLVPVRKPGKLPGKTVSVSYELEYGTDSVQMHEDAIENGDRVVVVDDLLATGGTAAAVCRLVRGQGASLAGAAFMVELDFLKGREKLPGIDIFSILHY